MPSLRAIIADAPVVLSELARAHSKPIVVMGRSLGSACASEIYGRSPRDTVKGVILESAFSDLVGLTRRRGLVPPKAFTAEEVSTFDPIEKLRRGDLPLLVLHGEEDELISAAEGRVAFEMARTEDKKLVLVPDRGHNDLSSSELYWRSISDFVRRLCA